MNWLTLQDPTEDCAPSPEELFLRKEERRSLWAACSRLTELQRQVVFLHYRNDLPLVEVASFLKITFESAKHIRASALVNLRMMLAAA